MASSTIQSVSNTLNGFGVDFEAFPIQCNGLNPIVDFKTYLSLRKSFIKNKPPIILAYTIKPII